MALRVDPLQGGPDRSSAYWLVAFFVVVYAASAAAWAPILRSGRPLFAQSGPLSLLLLLITIMPSLAAILLSGLGEGWPGVRALLGQAGRWRFALPWYVVALSLTLIMDLSTSGSLLATILYHEGIHFGDPVPVGSTVTSALTQAAVFVAAALIVVALTGPRTLTRRPRGKVDLGARPLSEGG